MKAVRNIILASYSDCKVDLYPPKKQSISKGVNLLGIDASSENISLCIKQDGKIKLDFNRRLKFGASRLIPYIEKAFKESSLTLKSFDAFVVGSGPGSFTGLRISFSIIKAFMLATGKPAIAIGSFFSCAYPFLKRQRQIAVISDARKNLIYAACFKPKGAILEKEDKEKLYSLEEFINKRKEHLFITYDAHLRAKALAYNSHIDFYARNIYPRALYLLPFAEMCYNKRRFTPLEKLEPIYLHPKTCQIRKK